MLQAKNEAERILGVAQAEADAKIQQEEVVKQANAVAEEIKANALRYQEDTKLAADEYALRVKQESLQYADDMLAFLGDNLQSAQDVTKLMQAALDKYQQNNEFQAEIVLDPTRELNVLTTFVRSSKEIREAAFAMPEAGVAAKLTETQKETLRNIIKMTYNEAVRNGGKSETVITEQ